MIKMEDKLITLNEEQENEVKAGFVLALFSCLYKKNKITLKEFKALKKNTERTFNIKLN